MMLASSPIPLEVSIVTKSTFTVHQLSHPNWTHGYAVLREAMAEPNNSTPTQETINQEQVDKCKMAGREVGPVWGSQPAAARNHAVLRLLIHGAFPGGRMDALITTSYWNRCAAAGRCDGSTHTPVCLPSHLFHILAVHLQVWVLQADGGPCGKVGDS